MDRPVSGRQTRTVRPTHSSDDPRVALDRIEPFLLAEPVRRNQLLTMFARLVATEGSTGSRTWWTTGPEDGSVTSVAVQAEPGARVLVSASSTEAVDALAAAVHDIDSTMGEIGGEAATVARFAGAWTDLAGGSARPVEGERLYQLDRLESPTGVVGSARRATVDDVPILTGWHLGFCAEVGVEPWPDPAATLAVRVAERGMWVWQTDRPVAMATTTTPIAGASRIAHVYTPPEDRGRGHAAAVTAAATGARLDEGVTRCLLFTQLANGTSNGVYRRLGYRAIEERLVYRLDAGA